MSQITVSLISRRLRLYIITLAQRLHLHIYKSTVSAAKKHCVITLQQEITELGQKYLN